MRGAMSEAEQLLCKILEERGYRGCDGAGRTILQLAVDDNDLERLMAFGGDDEPYSVPTFHSSWFEAA
jgi:hypothetical protein